MWGEEHLIYFPDRYPSGLYGVAEAGGLDPGEGQVAPAIEDCWLTAEDGVRLHGWLCTPRTRRGGEVTPVPCERVLLWFHGNAGNLTYRLDLITLLVGLPARVLIIDYRGYGRSEGSPSEEGLYRDARAAWAYLTGERAVAPSRVVLLGKSLGGAPACDLATRVEPAGLIIQSSFSSIRDMAGVVLPLLGRHLTRTRMDSAAKVATLRCPKLFIHSPADEVIPYRLGRRLFEAAAEPKEFYEVPGAPHNELYVVGGAAYLERLRGFLDRCCPD